MSLLVKRLYISQLLILRFSVIILGETVFVLQNSNIFFFPHPKRWLS